MGIDIDLAFLAQQNERILQELAVLRAESGEVRPLLDTIRLAVQALQEDVRAVHAQISRLDARLRALEEKHQQ
jgi:hypothetical protein